MYRKLILVSTLLAGTAMPAMAQQFYNGGGLGNTNDGRYTGNTYSPTSNTRSDAASSGNSTNIGATSNNSAGGSLDFHNNDLGATANGGAGGQGGSGGNAASGAYNGGSRASTGASTSAGGRAAGGSATSGGSSNDNSSRSKNSSETSPLTALSLVVPGPRVTAGTQFIAPNGTAPIEAHDTQFGWGLFQHSYEGPTDAGTIGTRVSLIGQACSIPMDQGRSAAVQMLAALDPDAGKALAHNGCR